MKKLTMLSVRIPPDMKRELRIEAAKKGTTVQAVVLERLERGKK